MVKEVASKDKPDEEGTNIGRFFYSKGDVLSIEPDDDRFQKIINQKASHYRGTNLDMIGYGRQCVEILEMRIAIATRKNDYDTAQRLENERVELRKRLQEMRKEYSELTTIHGLERCAKDASITSKQFSKAQNFI